MRDRKEREKEMAEGHTAAAAAAVSLYPSSYSFLSTKRGRGRRKKEGFRKEEDKDGEKKKLLAPFPCLSARRQERMGRGEEKKKYDFISERVEGGGCWKSYFSDLVDRPGGKRADFKKLLLFHLDKVGRKLCVLWASQQTELSSVLYRLQKLKKCTTFKCKNKSFKSQMNGQDFGSTDSRDSDLLFASSPGRKIERKPQ